jgi:hypothetical protein
MAISDGCMPGDRLHLVNISPAGAHVELTFCAEGGQPLGPFRVVVPPRSTLSPALADLVDADLPLPSLPYCAVVVSDAPVLVQSHPTNQDVRQAA